MWAAIAGKCRCSPSGISHRAKRGFVQQSKGWGVLLFMRRSGLLSLAGILLMSALSGCVVRSGYPAMEGEVVVESEPPPVQVEIQPARPWVDGVWIDGYWSWSGQQYVWAPGRWERPRPGFVWTPHRWTRHGRHWKYLPGHWHRH